MRKLLLLCSFLILIVSEGYSQARLVKGVVTDAASKPLEGATVVVVETQKATTTDASGNFQIMAENGQTIKVSYVGNTTVSVIVSADTKTLRIQFKDNQSSLNEVVVTGYTTERKKDLLGAVSVVNLSDIKNVPSTSPLLAL